MMTTSNGKSWQRWALDNLASTQVDEEASYLAKRKELTAFQASLQAEKLAFEAEKERVFSEAKIAGFAEGKEQGYEQGFEAGFEEGKITGHKEARDEPDVLTQQLFAITELFVSEIKDIQSVLPEKLLSVALASAKHLVQMDVSGYQAMLSDKVQQELEKLPIAPKQLTLKIHPSDWEFINESLKGLFAQNNWKMLKDEQLMSGGFQLETDTQEIDASLEKRWADIVTLGRKRIPNAK